MPRRTYEELLSYWDRQPDGPFGPALNNAAKYVASRELTEARVSDRGQMALPAQTRHRWGLDSGGTVGWIDLGDAVMLVPGGTRSEARRGLDCRGHRVGDRCARYLDDLSASAGGAVAVANHQ